MKIPLNILVPVGVLCCFHGSMAMADSATSEGMKMEKMPENLYQGELVNYPGPWAFQIGRSHIILVNDEELETLARDPDADFDMTLGNTPHITSLRKICEAAKAQGHRTLIVAFDHFFSQYRPGQGDKPRALTPDMDEYIEKIAIIGKFAEQYGLGFELSLLSPLEIGRQYVRKYNEGGRWMQYRKGLRDTATGAFDVQLWQHKKWASNKGPVDLVDDGRRVFAFKETPIWGTPYRMVNPQDIIEITDLAQMEVLGASTGHLERIRVFGKGRTDLAGYDHVMVVQQYRLDEMDYFDQKAFPFLKDIIDRYLDKGVKLNGLYSDEIHIQQDWGYFNHHDHGQFTTRYVSDGLARKYAELYGTEYQDFAKYLVYFIYGQEDFAHDLTATEGIQHVMGASPEDIRKTALFRSRYYELLQEGVKELFVSAKRYAEQRCGYRLEARAHATWAESPTIDKWQTWMEHPFRNMYEYTSNFIWSNTVHQSSAACSDYFSWGDFLTGNGTDHAEGGWLDRNYYANALACSMGILNDVPYSYSAHWGMAQEISDRRMGTVSTYGASGSPLWGLVQDMQHRDVEVLMLYPLDLVSVEERFGSWMTQYGYTNYVTRQKLLERGVVRNGAIEMAGRRFTTLVALFEPFPTPELLEMMKALAESGGRVIWAGPPPVIDRKGNRILDEWMNLFQVDYIPLQVEGRSSPGKLVQFEGRLAGMAPMPILTDFLVDHIYPVTPRPGSEVIARVKGAVVGTIRGLSNSGTATFLGFRPRDDQSQSLGEDSRYWFDILNTLGAYPPSGKFASGNDNTEVLSRTTGNLVCRFPNGCVAITPHFKDYEEGWPGGFARDRAADEAYLKANPLPSWDLKLTDYQVNGHTVTYSGVGPMAFRVDDKGTLVAFAGSASNRITIDGKETLYADQPVGQLAWAPVPEDRRVPQGAILQAMVYGGGTVHIPLNYSGSTVEVVHEGSRPGSRGEVLPSEFKEGVLTFTVAPESGRWIYVIGK